MTVVVGTAGHIDHGKTTLLRALTGIDADRLPEERARGMTIDVGYAHLVLPDGSELDFVDVPGHDRLIGNMLVGAGEIDAALLVVAADDGPWPQTIEHLELLDGLGIRHGLAVVTKTDGAENARVTAVLTAVRELLEGTSLRGASVIAASAATGVGLPEVRAALLEVRDAVTARRSGEGDASAGPRLAIDRVFTIRGRGTVVTGTLRGGPVRSGDLLRVVPGGAGSVRVREVQVHGGRVEAATSGRVALNVVVGDPAVRLGRGVVLTTDSSVVASDRIFVALAPVVSLPQISRVARDAPVAPGPVPDTADGARSTGPRGARRRMALAEGLPADRTRVTIHAGTAHVAAVVGRAGRDAVSLEPDGGTAILRLEHAIAVAPGDRIILRRESPPGTLAGGRVIDPDPPRGAARRRATPERVAALANATPGTGKWHAARLDLHGLRAGSPPELARDLVVAVDDRLLAEVVARPGLRLAELIAVGGAELRKRVGPVGSTPASSAGSSPHSRPGGRGPIEIAVTERISRLVDDGRLVRDGDRVRPEGAAAPPPPPALLAAMDRLVGALSTPTPPSLAAAAVAAACSAEGVRLLEAADRIIRLDGDLAWETGTWRALASRAVVMAATRPLTPAAFRDATGTSRKYVMAILEDLDRRAILRRTEAGHVPGPRASSLAGIGSDPAARR